MACGDPGAAFRVAILDPELTVSAPRGVTATAGYDALAHAIETFVTTKRSPFSDVFSREAWRLLCGSFERVLDEPDDAGARAAMLLGAHYAGLAIEASMLGATHACANPLTARHGTAHGVAVALFLPHVVRWNAAAAGDRYAELEFVASGQTQAEPAGSLAHRLEALALHAELPRSLRAIGVSEGELTALAEDAARQWTGRFNPRPFDATGALELYREAM
jgi:alcohol dehydrogenase